MRSLVAALGVAAVALLVAASAGAAPTNVEVRIEGRAETLFEGRVQTEPHGVRAASDTKLAAGKLRRCDGLNPLDPQNTAPAVTPTAASADAMALLGETFDGQWYKSYQDYFVTRFGPDAQNVAANALLGHPRQQRLHRRRRLPVPARRGRRSALDLRRLQEPPRPGAVPRSGGLRRRRTAPDRHRGAGRSGAAGSRLLRRRRRRQPAADADPAAAQAPTRAPRSRRSRRAPRASSGSKPPPRAPSPPTPTARPASPSPNRAGTG